MKLPKKLTKKLLWQEGKVRLYECSQPLYTLTDLWWEVTAGHAPYTYLRKDWARIRYESLLRGEKLVWAVLKNPRQPVPHDARLRPPEGSVGDFNPQKA